VSGNPKRFEYLKTLERSRRRGSLLAMPCKEREGKRSAANLAHILMNMGKNSAPDSRRVQ
ncbi:MAG: hypothetical protein SNH35_08325, partial [Rikenellaceae bacterium]